MIGKRKPRSKQEELKKISNPLNKQGYSKVITHFSSLPCNRSSMYGLNKTDEMDLVTCAICIRMLREKKEKTNEI